MPTILRTVSDWLVDTVAPRATAAADTNCGCMRDPADGTWVWWYRPFEGYPCQPSAWECR